MTDADLAPDTAARAFLSYARRDDEREDGRIHRLATLIREEFETLTGSTIDIFTDQTKIEWGDDFRQKLDEAMEATTFFIPVLTPTYFTRDECRKEMQTFVASATRLGLSELLLSIRYLPVADMTESSSDTLKAVAARMSYEPWEGLRLEAENSPDHRKAINRLARRLVDLTAKLEGENAPQPLATAPGGSLAGVTISQNQKTALPEASTHQTPGESLALPQGDGALEEEDDDDAPGTLDLIADVVPAMTDWSETMASITEATKSFGNRFAAATENLPPVNSAPDSLAKRILAFRALAADIEPDLVSLELLSKKYAVGVMRIDTSLRAIANLVKEEGADASTAREGIAALVASSTKAMQQLSTAADIARTNSKHSRDLRPVLRRYETAMRNIIDASRTIEEWESQFGTD